MRSVIRSVSTVVIPHLERNIVTFPDVSCQFDDSLHPLHLPLNVDIKVLFLDFREHQEVNRARVPSSRIFGDVLL